MPKLLRNLLFTLLLAGAVPGLAAEADKANPATAAGGPVAEARDKVELTVRRQLASMLRADVEITLFEASPVPGLYHVEFNGETSGYITSDGRWLIGGDLFQVTPGKGLVNYTDKAKEGLRRQALGRLDPAQMILFPARGKEKFRLYVFTDVDCGYCRKMHQELPQLNEAGITVAYLAFPRAGLTGETARKMDAVWCAGDRNKAMTAAKRGTEVPTASKSCRSPVAEQYKLGGTLGVRGTPAVFTADGEQLGGYVPAAKLIEDLGRR